MSGKLDDRFRVPAALWRGIERIGLSAPVVLRQAQLPATLHLRDKGQLNTEEYFRLWKAIEALSADSAPGIALATLVETAVLPPSSLAAFYARDFRDGLFRLARFKPLCAPERIDVVETGGECNVAITWLHAVTDEPDALADAAFASFVELGRQGIGKRIVPRRVDLKRAHVFNDRHRDYFGCPIRFGAARNVLVLEAADLDLPFPGHNPELLELLNPALASLLEEQGQRSSTSDQVKMVLKRALPSGRPDFADIARDMGMSERTLQRRITDEGSSFRQLLLEARQALVRQFLLDPSLEIAEVASLVGFEDGNSFFRAFRSWEGTTPSQWREAHC